MKRLLAFALLALIFSGCKQHGPRYLLRLKYTKGIHGYFDYHFYIVASDAPDDMIQNQLVRMSFNVDSVMSNSVFRLSAKINNVQIKNKGGTLADRELTYDSDDRAGTRSDEGQSYDDHIRPLIDSTLSFEVNKRGEVVKPFTFLHGRGLTAPLPMNYGFCQIKFPTDSVAIGEEWTDKLSLGASGDSWATHYYLDRIADSSYYITLYGELVHGSTSSKFTGLYQIEQKTGALVSGKIEIEGMTEMGGTGKLVIEVTQDTWGVK